MGGRENGSGGGESEEEEGDGGIGAAGGDRRARPPPPSFRPPPLVLPDDDGMAAAGLPMSFGGGGGGGLSAAAAAALRPPPVFQKKRPREEEGKEQEEERGNGGAASDDGGSGEEQDSDEEGGGPNPFRLPVSRSALFEPTERGVTALALDRAGSRLACGSRDGRVRLFDFGGARSDLKPFRTFFPLSGGGGGGDGGERGDGEGAGATPPVVSLCWLPGGAAAGGGGAAGGAAAGGAGDGGGALLLVACADARLVLCDREGRRLCESARGDSYLADPKNTAGHTAPLTSCCCLGGAGGAGAPPASSKPPAAAAAAPSSASTLAEVASGSEDGTVRLWAVLYDADRDAFSLKQRVVIKVPSAPGGGAASSNRRTKVSALAFLASSAAAAGAASSPCSPARNPSLLVAGTDDGAIHAWDPRARKGRPAAAGAVVTGPTARMMGLSARQKDWAFVAGSSTSTSRSVFGAHGGGGRGALPSCPCPRVTALAAPPAHLDDGATVASRGEDGTVRLWDLASEGAKPKKQPPLVWSAGGGGGQGGGESASPPSPLPRLSLPAEEPTTGLAWSPDGRIIATGTAEGTVAFLETAAGGGGSGKEGGGGALARSISVADRIKKGDENSAPSAPSSCSTCSVVPVCWHPKLNQVLVGVSDPAAARRKLGGRVVALFSPKLSERGVLLALSRTKRVRKDEDGAVAVSERPGEIYNPHALPLYRAERSVGVPLAATGGSRRSKDDEAAAAAAKSAAHLPGRGGGGPALGAGSGGRIGVTGGTLLTQHVLKSRGGFGLVAPSEEGDIRERMLAHGDLARKDPGMAALTSAYRETQPERVFQKGKKEEEGDEEEDE